MTWDMSGYEGQTDGELTLTGQFLDESGQPLSSLVPLTLRVRWYTPGTLVVTKAEWKGSTVPTVELTVEELPEFADVWGEVSTDGGVTWTRWEDEDRFFIVEVKREGWACIFQLGDETSGLFRVAAEDPWADPYAYWRSESFALSPPEDGEDSGGNRGGSTTPGTPDREPEPEPRPEDPTLEKPQDLLPEPDIPEEEGTAGEEQDFTERPLTDSGREETPEAAIPAAEENQNHPGGYRPEYLVQTRPDKSTQDETAEQDDSLTMTEQEPDSAPQSDQVEEISAPVAAVEDPALAEVEEVAVVQTMPQSLSAPLQFLLAAAGLAACVAAAVAVGVLRKRK